MKILQIVRRRDRPGSMTVRTAFRTLKPGTVRRDNNMESSAFGIEVTGRISGHGRRVDLQRERKRNGAYVTEQAPLSLYRAIEAALRATNVFCAQWGGVEHGGGTGRFVRLGALKGASAAVRVAAACALSAKKQRPGELQLLAGASVYLTRNLRRRQFLPQQFLYFFPLPHGQGSLRPTFGDLLR